MPVPLEPVPMPMPGAGTVAELVGRASTAHRNVSVSRVDVPTDWTGPGQRPAFDEVVYVVAGELRVEHRDGTDTLTEGGAALSRAGDWVRYAAGPDGAGYLSVCVPAYSEEGARRDG